MGERHACRAVPFAFRHGIKLGKSMQHRFGVGDRVQIVPGPPNGVVRPGIYTITRLLPVNGTRCQYRGRNSLDTFERVLDEPQLTLVRG